jgi:hypothetical protein
MCLSDSTVEEETMKRSVLALALIITLPACAVQKTLIPTGGSRSDGTVELSYDVC